MKSILATTRVVILLLLESYDTQIRGHKKWSMVEQSYQKTKQNNKKQNKTKTIILVFFRGVWEIDYEQSLAPPSAFPAPGFARLYFSSAVDEL